MQSTLFRLGRVPAFHPTDNSTAATHDLRTGKRGFNEEYRAMMAHFGLTPRTIGIGEKEQNGDIEASHGVLKRRLAQHLLLRCSRDFESEDAYEVQLPRSTYHAQDFLEAVRARRPAIAHVEDAFQADVRLAITIPNTLRCSVTARSTTTAGGRSARCRARASRRPR